MQVPQMEEKLGDWLKLGSDAGTYDGRQVGGLLHVDVFRITEVQEGGVLYLQLLRLHQAGERDWLLWATAERSRIRRGVGDKEADKAKRNASKFYWQFGYKTYKDVLDAHIHTQDFLSAEHLGGKQTGATAGIHGGGGIITVWQKRGHVCGQSCICTSRGREHHSPFS